MEQTTEDLEKDFHLEKRYWKVERIGWAVIGILVIAAFLGLTGPGPLSRKELRGPDGTVILECYGVLRYQTETDFKFHIPATDEKEASIGIDRVFLTELFPESIMPRPERAEERGEKTFYIFNLPGNSQSITVVFRFKPQKLGSLKGEIRLPGLSPIQLSHFVLM